MSAVTSKLVDLGWRRIVFTVLVLIPLLLYVGLFQMWRNQALVVTSWFGGFGLLDPVFYLLPHRLHEVAAAAMVWPLLVGLLAQFRSPKRHVAGMLMALLSMVGIFLAIALTGGWDVFPIIAFLGAPTLLATIAHPAGRELLGAFSLDRLNRITLVLVVIAAVPLLAFAADQVALQTGAADLGHGHAHDDEVHAQHVDHHHFMFVTAFVITVVGVGLLVSFQSAGWWLAAWVVGAMVAAFGLAGLLAPEASSNPGVLWNLAAVVWAVGFVAAAESTQDGDPPSLLAARRESPESAG